MIKRFPKKRFVEDLQKKPIDNYFKWCYDYAKERCKDDVLPEQSSCNYLFSWIVTSKFDKVAICEFTSERFELEFKDVIMDVPIVSVKLKL